MSYNDDYNSKNDTDRNQIYSILNFIWTDQLLQTIESDRHKIEMLSWLGGSSTINCLEECNLTHNNTHYIDSNVKVKVCVEL